MDTRQGDNGYRASNLLFAEVSRADRSSWNDKAINWLIGDASAVIKGGKKRSQSSRDAPVVLIRDLSQGAGDTVQVDLTHKIHGRPTMGSDYIEGKEELTTRATMKLSIDKYRKSVGSGGEMDQQRRPYDLVRLGRVELQDYFPRMKSELMWYHAAGARGKYDADDMIFPPMEPDDPLADESLPREYVNPLKPPTYNRHFYGGNADSVDGSGTVGLTAASLLNEETIERVAVSIKEMSSPPRMAKLGIKPTNGSSPLYFLFVTPRQMADFKRTSTRMMTWVQNAQARTRGFDHPLFTSQGFMVENIYVCEYFCPIRWYAGDIVNVSNNDKNATVSQQQVPAGVTMDRAIGMGAQALGFAMGGMGDSMTFQINKEKYDVGDKTRQVLNWSGGIEKMRFKNRTGWDYDYGVFTIDTAVTGATRPAYY